MTQPTDPSDPYRSLAAANDPVFEEAYRDAFVLKEVTGLEPVAIQSPPLGDEPVDIQVGPKNHWLLIHGLRLFVPPITVDLELLTAWTFRLGPFDAHVFSIDASAPAREVTAEYRGEPMRFISIDLGAASSLQPLVVRARRHPTCSDAPSLHGFVIGHRMEMQPLPPPRSRLMGKKKT